MQPGAREEMKKRAGIPEPALLFDQFSLSVFLFKLVFAYAAQGALPVPGHLLKRGACFYSMVGIALLRIVDISTDTADIPAHFFFQPPPAYRL